MKLQIFVLFCSIFIFPSTFSHKRRHSSGRSGRNDVQIVQWHANSFIRSRFATTVITSKIKNHADVSRETTFTAILPDGAYISNFTMEINGIISVGQVREKIAAREDYERHKSKKKSAGLIVAGTREANLFEIFINLEPTTEVHVKLIYEQILERMHGVYKHVIFVPPGQIVADLKLRTQIMENILITDLRVPEFAPNIGNLENIELLTKTETEKQFADVEVEVIDDFTRIVQYHPSVIEQTHLKNETGQFVVLYDVKRDDSYSRTFQVVDGWFVHFYAPTVRNHEVLNKRVLFVLDVSGSMLGEKLSQTKDAMKSILLQLNELDSFNLITFSSKAHIWKSNFLNATEENIKAAESYVDGFAASGGTNIDQALKKALAVLYSKNTKAGVSMIIFMTDGQPTWGERKPSELLKNIEKANIGDRTKFAIHTMAFGQDADFDLMKQISSNNNGIARRIYETSDASLQLQGFYMQISLPLLTNVAIEFLDESVEVGTIIQDINGISYEGGEHVSIGKLRKSNANSSPAIRANISSQGKSGPRRSNMVRRVNPEEMSSNAQKQTSLSLTTFGGFLERMWAYKTIKQLLDNATYVEQDPIKQATLKARALNLSLCYNFVTELTSMVVIVNNDAMRNSLEPIDPATNRKHFKKVEQRRRGILSGLQGHSSNSTNTVNNAEEQLVEISSAEAQCEGENEEWNPCGIQCEATCTPPKNCTETNCDNGTPACGCKPGFMRMDGRCIPFRECPRELNVRNCYIHCSKI